MDSTNLEKQLARMGARVTVHERPAGLAVDVRRDRLGLHFDIGINGAIEQLLVFVD